MSNRYFLNSLLVAFFLLLSTKFVMASDLAITNVSLISAPHEKANENTTIIIRNGVITEIGKELDIDGLPVVDAEGRIATAGFWNSHVHLIDPEIQNKPELVLKRMLLKYGFTSIVDTGSDFPFILNLRSRIRNGEILGPDILMAGGSIVPVDGVPFYLEGMSLPQVEVIEAAKPIVESVIREGADGIKIYSGSVQPNETILMAPEKIKAITKAAHNLGGFVISHPHDKDGLLNAINNGVDILAHTAPIAGSFEGEIVKLLIDKNVALIPTLKLWSWELSRFNVPAEEITRQQEAAILQVKQYTSVNGEILFGTDVGYMQDYDPSKEYELMQMAGLSFHDILETLTTNPSKRFTGQSGKVEVGAPGSIVIFEDNPLTYAGRISKLSYTIHKGKVVYENEKGS